MVFKKMTDEEYFAFDALNASTGKKHINTPARAQYKTEKTKGMGFGSVFHCLVLEPKEFDKRYIVEPKVITYDHLDKSQYELLIEDDITVASLDPKLFTIMPKVFDIEMLSDKYVTPPDDLITKSGTIRKAKQEEYDAWERNIISQNKKIIAKKDIKDIWLKENVSKKIIKRNKDEILKAYIFQFKLEFPEMKLLRTKTDISNAYYEQQEEKGLEVISRNDMAKALRAFKNFNRHKLIQSYFSEFKGIAYNELVCITRLPEFKNRLCKGKFDRINTYKLKDGSELVYLLDIKTVGPSGHIKLDLLSTDSTTTIVRKILNYYREYGYDMSLRFYCELWKAETGKYPDAVKIINVQTDKPPYEAYITHLDVSFLDEGLFKLKKIIKLVDKVEELDFHPKIDQVKWNEEIADWEFYPDGFEFVISTSEQQQRKIEELNI